MAEQNPDKLLRLLRSSSSKEVLAYVKTVMVPGFLVWRGTTPTSKKLQAAADAGTPEGISDRVAEAIDQDTLIFQSREDLAMTAAQVADEIGGWSFLVIDLAAYSRSVLGPAFGFWWQALRDAEGKT